MYELTILSLKTRSILDVSTLASNIEHFTSIQGQPGKLSFLLEKDPNNLLELSLGDIVSFTVTDDSTLKKYNLFKGKIFTLGTDLSEAYKVTAYDQTRYLKNKDTLAVNGTDDDRKTIDVLFKEICARNSLSYKIKATTPINLPSKMYADKTYFDILNENIQSLLTDSKGEKWFFVRDNYGVLELNELMSTKTKFIIGDDSLLSNYKYETSIDDDTYNRIKLMRPETNGSQTLVIKPMDDLDSIMKYGVLQFLHTVPAGTTSAQGDSLARKYLELKDRPTESITINAIGTPELNAGDGFILKLSKLKIFQYMFILSANHHYNSDNHTMDLEVSGFGSLKELQARTMNQLILETVNGEWGTEETRFNNYKELGFEPKEVQKKINDMYSKANTIKNGTYDGASKVDGVWTLSEELKNKLSTDGFEPSIIETILNQE